MLIYERSHEIRLLGLSKTFHNKNNNTNNNKRMFILWVQEIDGGLVMDV